MQLNLPIVERLQGCRNVLIAGMGGGFDVFCGLPLYVDLQQRGFNVHLANFSFSDIASLRGGQRLSETLLGVTYREPELSATGDWADPALGGLFAQWGAFVYFPELFLSQWFRQELAEEVTIWCFAKTGLRPLLANYRQLIEHLAIDAVVLIDGGVDSLARGDEHEMGTIIEDSISLAALNELDELAVRIVACLGLGAEQSITYAHIFENIATLTAQAGFLGACALTPAMAAYQAYESAVAWVHAQPYQDPSVINASVVSAVQGHFGDYHLTEKTHGSRLWISPLMTLYWFFDLPIVAQHNLLLSALLTTSTPGEAVQVAFAMRRHVRPRTASRVPL